MRSSFTAESVLDFTRRSSFREDYEILLRPALAAVQLTVDSRARSSTTALGKPIAAAGDIAQQTVAAPIFAVVDGNNTGERQGSTEFRLDTYSEA